MFARITFAAAIAVTSCGLAANDRSGQKAAAGPAEDEVVHLSELRVEDVMEEVEREGRSGELRSAPLHEGPAAIGSLPTLKSALGGLPGVVVQDSFGGFDPPRITSRGSGLQSAPVSRGLLWTIDGMPLNAADGSFNAALIEPALAESLDFRPGALDPRAAGLALGGSIDLTSPFTGGYPHVMAGGGDDGYMRAAFSAGSAVGENTFWCAGSLARSDGWREQSGQRRVVLAGCFTHHFGPDAPLLLVRLYGANPGFDVPGPLTLTAVENDPTSISANTLADRPRRETDLGRAALELQWGGGELRRFSLEFAAQTTRDWFRQLRANGISQTNGDDYTLRASLRRDMGKHRIDSGVSNLWGHRAQTRFANLSGTAGALFAALDLDARTSTAWFEDRWKLDDATVITPALSLVSVAREVHGSPAATGSMRDEDLAARLGLRRQMSKTTWLSAAVSRATEAPTFDDLLAVRGTPPNLSLAWTPLRSQRADTLELGLRHTWKNLSIDATAYTARWSNELLRLADASGAARGTMNAGPTRHRGLETALRWQLRGGTRPVALSLAHTWSEARFAGDAVYGRNHIAGLPPHAGSVSLASLPDEGWFGVLGASWIGGRTFADHANRLAYDGNFLVNARAGWKTKTWTFSLELNNALDRAHIASTAGVIDIARSPAATALFLPGAPRTLNTAFEWRW